MKVIIWTKCIIEEDNPKEFYHTVGEAMEQLESDAQQYGWGMSDVADDKGAPSKRLMETEYPG